METFHSGWHTARADSVKFVDSSVCVAVSDVRVVSGDVRRGELGVIR
jgi:hypothetical protein